MRGHRCEVGHVYLAHTMSGILLALGYTLLILYGMRRSVFYGRVPGLPFKWIAALFLLRIAAGTALWAVYSFIYTDRAAADVFKYFDDSAFMHAALRERPMDYLRMITGVGNDTPYFHELYYARMNNWVRHFESNLYNDAHTIIRFNALVRLISFGEFHVHTVVTAFLSFTGLIGLYRAIIPLLPDRKALVAIALFALPSVLFWASGVIKESLLFFGIGTLFYLLSRLFAGRMRWWEWAFILFTVIALFFLKFYVLLSLLPALSLAWWARSSDRPGIWVKAMATYGVFILIGLNLHHLIPGMDILGILTMKQRDFIGLALQMRSGSFVMPTLLLPDPWLFLQQVPYAWHITLVGPILHPGSGPLGFLSALENLLIVLFLVFCVIHRKPFGQWNWKLMVPMAGYILLLAAVIGWTTPVMGAVVRYRTPLLPFIIILGLLMLDGARAERSFPRTRKLFSA